MFIPSSPELFLALNDLIILRISSGKDLANGLSEYYNSLGRLAVVRRRFESPSRRPGVDLELWILAVRGFEDMGERARDLIIRNKFIAAQQNCELRRHLDGASADAFIRDIVDSCRVWECHTEAEYSGNGGPDPKLPQTISQVAEDTQRQVVSTESETLHESKRLLLPTPALPPPRVTLSSSYRELLIQRVLKAVRPGQSVIQKLSQGPDIELMLWSMLQVSSVTEVDVPTPMPCLEGESGSVVGVFLLWTPKTDVHRWTAYFPFLSTGWSVDVRNGRYRASRMDGIILTGDRSATDPGGGMRVLGGHQLAWQQQVGSVRGSHWTPNVQGFPALGSHANTDDGRCERPFPDDSGEVSENETAKVPISTLEMGGGPVVSQGREMGDPKWGMRPAGAGRSSPQKPVVDLSDVRGNAAVRPLSVEAAEFSPALGPWTRETTGTVALSSVAGAFGPILPEYLFRLWLG